LHIPSWEVSEEMIFQNQAGGDGARLYWWDRMDWDPDCWAEGRKRKRKRERKKRKRGWGCYGVRRREWASGRGRRGRVG